MQRLRRAYHFEATETGCEGLIGRAEADRLDEAQQHAAALRQREEALSGGNKKKKRAGDGGGDDGGGGGGNEEEGDAPAPGGGVTELPPEKCRWGCELLWAGCWTLFCPFYAFHCLKTVFTGKICCGAPPNSGALDCTVPWWGMQRRKRLCWNRGQGYWFAFTCDHCGQLGNWPVWRWCEKCSMVEEWWKMLLVFPLLLVLLIAAVLLFVVAVPLALLYVVALLLSIPIYVVRNFVLAEPCDFCCRQLCFSNGLFCWLLGCYACRAGPRVVCGLREFDDAAAAGDASSDGASGGGGAAAAVDSADTADVESGHRVGTGGGSSAVTSPGVKSPRSRAAADTGYVARHALSDDQGDEMTPAVLEAISSPGLQTSATALPTAAPAAPTHWSAGTDSDASGSGSS